MEVKTLGELCNIVSGGTPSRSKTEFWNEGTIPWIKIGNIRGKYVDEADEYITQAGLEGSSTKLLSKGTVLYTIFATLGEVGVLGIDACTNQAIAGLIIKDDNKLDTGYLYYYLKSKKSYVTDVGRGVAQNNINMSILRNFEIPLPDLSAQKKIVAILDKVSKVIDYHEQEIKKLDNLIKARFVEMFGDPVSNPLNWEMRTVIEECGCMVPGRDKPKSFTGEIPWITIEDLNINGVTESSKSGLGLTEEEINQVGRKTIPAGSVIMSCVGNLGICSIAGKEMVINQQLHSFQCGDNINNVFLMHYLGYRKDYMNKWASNTTVLYMNKTVCNSVPIMIPPMELQKEFVSFVAQVDKSKVAVKKALDETQLLFDSLMQQYFG